MIINFCLGLGIKMRHFWPFLPLISGCVFFLFGVECFRFTSLEPS